MIGFLRNTSARTLAVTALALTGLLAGGAVIATGAASSGSKPVPKPLANAIAGSLGSKTQFEGVSARVTFTNTLLDSSGITGAADPLAGGGSGRLWADADGRVRVELQSDGGGGDVQMMIASDMVWLSHGASGMAWKATIPAEGTDSYREPKAKQWPPTVAAVARAIRQLSGDARISKARPDNVGGRPAYTVTITPRDTSGLLAGGTVSWDAANGAPLALSILADGQSEPVLALRTTEVEFGPVDGSVFDLAPPANAEEVDLAALRSEAGAKAAKLKGKRLPKPITGLARVKRAAPFAVVAPATLAGRKLATASLMGKGTDAKVLLTYGTGMGAIAVIEAISQPKPSESADKPEGGWHGDGGALPTLDIAGVEGTKLQTSLGSIVSFTRAGTSFTVMGSVPGDEVVAAAKQLR